MQGAIHGIWLNKSGNSLHPAIIPKFSAWAPVAAESDFQVVLWTNTDVLTQKDIDSLKKTNIVLADPRSCKDSPLYEYYSFFFEKGLAGDKAAFAMASDILRMAILDFTAEDKYFIYVDPNDIELTELKDDLQHLDCRMKNNKFGFSFPVGRPNQESEIFDVRNDVLIAKKNQNPEFFKQHLEAYWANLEKTYKNYKAPANNTEANILVNTISSNTSSVFFKLEKNDNSDFITKYNPIVVITQYADFKEASQLVNSGSYLHFKRVIEHGNTWLPSDEMLSQEEMASINALIQSNVVSEKSVSTATETNSFFTNIVESSYKYTKHGMYAIPVLIVILGLIIYKKSKKKIISLSVQ